MTSLYPACVECGIEMPGSRPDRKYCSIRCKARWWKTNAHMEPVTSHVCRECGTAFPISRVQHNKWLCSRACIRAANARSTREFHARRPSQMAAYRARTKAKLPPDSQNRRFYRLNPDAPRACESCGETRVTEIAHRPGHERHGERRTAKNMVWPEKVWVLCPTCHRLLDRMHYPPNDLGLS